MTADEFNAIIDRNRADAYQRGWRCCAAIYSGVVFIAVMAWQIWG